MELNDQDSAFIIGRMGACKMKISRASGAKLDLRDGRLQMTGTTHERARARKYVNLVKQQRLGPVFADVKDIDDGDLTILEVPSECVAYVTGKKGATMRTLEEEWDTVMFFLTPEGERERYDRENDGSRRFATSTGKTQSLAIFGDRRGRRGTEIKVMSAIEQKCKGYFTSGVGTKETADEWGTDTMMLSYDDLSYALGKMGSTRRKLARAAHCIVQYVGLVAFLAGTKVERARAKEYLSILLAQRKGEVHVENANDREDCEVVEIPQHHVGYVTGNKGNTLRNVEEKTGTFCLIDGQRGGDLEKLLIFSSDRSARKKARSIVEDMLDVKDDRDRRGRDDRDRRDSSRDRRRSRSPRRSPRRASRSRSRSRRRD